ncbi:Uncharacterised protein [Chlamydia trachomatis]|nr:Uncharacterised protein [Chlamydia trachomatis]
MVAANMFYDTGYLAEIDRHRFFKDDIGQGEGNLSIRPMFQFDCIGTKGNLRPFFDTLIKGPIFP